MLRPNWLWYQYKCHNTVVKNDLDVCSLWQKLWKNKLSSKDPYMPVQNEQPIFNQKMKFFKMAKIFFRKHGNFFTEEYAYVWRF